VLRTAKWLLLAGWGALGVWHLAKPLPPGLRVEGAWTDLPPDDVRPLIDLTTADAFGQPVLQQQIFDETLQVIAGARRFVVLDQFLFNDHQGAIAEPAAPPAGTAAGAAADAGEPNLAPLRPLSRELTEALLAAKRARPALRVLFITDPINDVYGGAPSPELARLEAAGIEVVRTELDALRDSNPAWSGLWRLTIDWWDGDAGGPGWLPNPLETGPSRVTFRAWARLLNFKANHRKVVIADDGSEAAGLVGIVGSANPHDASSAHTNLALELRGEALRPLLESEFEIARFSGWTGSPWPTPGTPPLEPVRQRVARAQVLTEGAIRDALLERFAATRAGEHIDVAMFYLSERALVEALLAAARRGVEVRLLLDPNKDAFGRAKGGVPNRPVASELVSRSDGAIKVRWYRTHGEQFHPKLVMVRGTGRTWLTLGSANLTRRNVGDFNLEANLAVESATDAAVARELADWFETVWSNRAPAGIEYSADFGTFADPAQSSYWAYRLMEATGLSTF
jgi:phosphatidylserine/phosphatidylglycerophosphate/cardiolipin synthase-like enzyme